MTSLSLDNRRNNFRVPRPEDRPWQIHIDDNLITKNIVDLSASGLSFKAPSSYGLQPGQVLNLGIRLGPENEFQCQGRILWSATDLDSKGEMKVLGVKFENLPLSIDTKLAQELHKEALKAHWSNPASDLGRLPVLGQAEPTSESRNEIIPRIMALALIACFLTAAHYYQKLHREDSIEYRFNQGLAKKIGHW